jgi:glyoxylase-like metal-dependent hydrolase (beta-lactamase superfamily II)
MIKKIDCGLLGSSVYIVYTKESKRAMIVDCGVPIDEFIDFIVSEKLFVDYIVLTHGHFDHVDYIDKYVAIFRDAKILCHVDELKVLLDPEANLSPYIATTRVYRYPYVTVNEGDMISIGKNDEISFKIIHTPGHTPGSMCLLCEKDKVMITGDTLFKGSYGRIDFKYGSRMDMYASLCRLLSLDPEITFYPGHGESSAISKERY